MTIDALDLFERAFKTNDHSCRRTCACGLVFFDVHNHWDWEDGEMESLLADKEATAIEHAIGGVVIDNAEFVMDCNCWHPAAEKLIRIIRSNKRRIANFINLEAEWLEHLAQNAPKVKSE